MNMITLLDLAKHKGNDAAVGLIDSTRKMVPEMDRITGRVISGTYYEYLRRTKKATGAFRKGNQGVALDKNEYVKEFVQAFAWNAKMRIDKALAAVAPEGAAAYIAQEAQGQFEGAMESLAHQVFYGDQASSDGFNGLQAAATRDGSIVDIGGSSSGSLTSAYLVFTNTPKAVHFIYGGDGEIGTDTEWVEQDVADAEGKVYRALTNDILVWMGLSTPPGAAIRLANVHPGTSDLSDSNISEALSKVPRGVYGDPILFMNRDGAHSLQRTRSATTNRRGVNGAIWADWPVESNGVPIVVTDTLSSEEATVS